MTHPLPARSRPCAPAHLAPLALALSIAAAFPSTTLATPAADSQASTAVADAAETAHAGHAAPPPPADDTTALATVTVRARLADEAARDVPFSINVIDGRTLEARRLYSLQDALWQVPGVELNDGLGDTWNANVRIRGVGALQKVSNEDSSVILNVDGVPLPIGNISSLAFDLERVEILKGPQGTLFSGHSEAGAINVVTAKPTRHLEGYVRAEVGSEGQRMAETALSGPLSPTLSGRLALRSTRSDHWVENQHTGEPINTPRDLGVRGTLLWQPDAATQLTLSAQHDTLRGHPGYVVLRPYGKQPTMDIGDIRLPDDRRQVDRFSAVFERDLGQARLTWIGAYANADTSGVTVPYEGNVYRQLIGMMPQDGGYFIVDNDETTVSQELRLSSQPGAALFWVAGLSWLRQDRHVDMPFGQFDHFYPGSTVNADTLRHMRSDSRALFGEATVPLGERFKLTGGLRHTWDHKRYAASWTAVADNPSPIRHAEDRDALRDHYTTGRLALSWALDHATNLYAVAARGYKSGGYNDYGTNITLGGQDAPYDPARVNSLEIGFKHERADGRLGLNGALFHTRSQGDHLQFGDPFTFETYAENVDTRSRGLELSGFWQPGGGFTLNLALAYTDAEITGVPTGSTTGAATGNRVPDSPRWSGTLSVLHRQPLQRFLGWAGPTLTSRLDARAVGNRANDPQNNFTLPGYHQLDLRLGVNGRSGGNGSSAELYLWVKNLTDKQFDQYAFYYPSLYEGGPDGVIGSPSRARSFGVGFAYAF